MNKKTVIRITFILSSIFLAFILLKFVLRLKPGLDTKLEEMKKFYLFLHPYYGHYDAHPYIAGHIKKKEKNEYVILLLGGSTAQGSGSSADDKTIPLQLENYLNSKNEFSNISKFTVHDFTHHGYHTSQVRNIFVQLIVNNSEIDLVLSIDGFNNLVRPLENAAYGLPLSYPGWYWVAYHRLVDKDRYFCLIKHYKELKEKKWILKLKIIELIYTKWFHKKAAAFMSECHDEIISRVSSIPEEKLIQILYDSAEFYKNDISFMAALAKAKNIKSLFVLHPILGFERNSLTEFEKEFIEERPMFDFRQAPLNVWISGYKKLRSTGMELKNNGINFLDYTAVFRDLKENPFSDLMHMNDFGQQIFAEKLSDYILDLIKDDFSG